MYCSIVGEVVVECFSTFFEGGEEGFDSVSITEGFVFEFKAEDVES